MMYSLEVPPSHVAKWNSSTIHLFHICECLELLRSSCNVKIRGSALGQKERTDPKHLIANLLFALGVPWHSAGLFKVKSCNCLGASSFMMLALMAVAGSYVTKMRFWTSGFCVVQRPKSAP